MAAKKGDYFGLSYIVSLILAIIPITAWICGMITRFSEGKIVAGIIRIFGGWLIWIIDLICMGIFPGSSLPIPTINSPSPCPPTATGVSVIRTG